MHVCGTVGGDDGERKAWDVRRRHHGLNDLRYTSDIEHVASPSAASSVANVQRSAPKWTRRRRPPLPPGAERSAVTGVQGKGLQTR